MSDDELMEEDVGGAAVGLDQGYSIDLAKDIGLIDFLNLRFDEVDRFHFGDLAIAYEFYNNYAKIRGFSERKSKTRKNNDGEVIKQKFVCFREGFRPDKFCNLENRKKELRVETRCGCFAMFEVQFHSSSGRWLVSLFLDEHNH